MDSEMIKSSTKGEDELKLIISPVGNLETEFFNSLFSGEVIVEKVPGNSTAIVIKKNAKTE